MATKQKIETEVQAKKHFDLHGFPEIENFLKKPSNRGFINFIQWRNLWNFPIHSIENQWFALKAEIEAWAKELGFRSCDYRDLDFSRLEKERLLEMRETGEIRKFNFMIHDANLISEFCGKSLSTVMGWARDRDGCPIIKNENGWQADADELQKWLEEQGLIGFRCPGTGIDVNKFVKAERRRGQK